MITRRHIIIIAGLITLLLACSDEPNYVRDYPRILTTEVTAVSSVGVTISGTFDEATFNKVTDYGIVWSSDEDLAADFDPTVHAMKPTSPSFSLEARSDMVKGAQYFARAFVLQGKRTIYGPIVNFVSLGSEGIIIESVSPELVNPNEQVTITGKNFGTNRDRIEVFFRTSVGDYPVYVENVTDTQISLKFIQLPAPSANIVVRKFGNNEVVSSFLIRRPFPTLTGINATELCNGFEITGENFNILGAPLWIYINDNSIPTTINDNLIFVDRYFHTRTVHVRLVYENNVTVEKTLNNPVPFPEVTSASPANVPESGILVLEGTNFPDCDLLMVGTVDGPFDNILEITDVTPTQVSLRVIYDWCGPFKINLLLSNGQQIYTSEPVLPAFPVITSITPDHGGPDIEVVIVGSRLTDNFVYLDLESDEAIGIGVYDIREFTPTRMVIHIPVSPWLDLAKSFPVVTMPLTVDNCGAKASMPFTLTVTPITINDYSPKTSNGNSQIVITGTNFLADPGIRVILEKPGYGFVFQDLTIIDTQITTEAPAGSLEPGTYKVVLQQYGIRYEFPDQITITP